MDERLILRIRERAYEIWASTGSDAEENWIRAEVELLKNSNSEPISSPAKKKRRAPRRFLFRSPAFVLHVAAVEAYRSMLNCRAPFCQLGRDSTANNLRPGVPQMAAPRSRTILPQPPEDGRGHSYCTRFSSSLASMAQAVRAYASVIT
jgi:hypothetical protein